MPQVNDCPVFAEDLGEGGKSECGSLWVMAPLCMDFGKQVVIDARTQVRIGTCRFQFEIQRPVKFQNDDWAAFNLPAERGGIAQSWRISVTSVSSPQPLLPE